MGALHVHRRFVFYLSRRWPCAFRHRAEGSSSVMQQNSISVMRRHEQQNAQGVTFARTELDSSSNSPAIFACRSPEGQEFSETMESTEGAATLSFRFVFAVIFGPPVRCKTNRFCVMFRCDTPLSSSVMDSRLCGAGGSRRRRRRRRMKRCCCKMLLEGFEWDNALPFTLRSHPSAPSAAPRRQLRRRRQQRSEEIFKSLRVIIVQVVIEDIKAGIIGTALMRFALCRGCRGGGDYAALGRQGGPRITWY